MATRNRTGLFLQYRQPFVRTSRGGGGGGANAAGRLTDPQTSETAGLISNTEGPAAKQQVIDIPPAW